MPRAQELISSAYQRFAGEVPALGNLKLTIRLELRGRGDVQVFGVRLPGPLITKGEPEDARLEHIFITKVDEPPEGIRLAVKDILDTAGIRTTYGSLIYEDHVPDKSAEAVVRLERAGYADVGKANLHEF